MTMAMVGRIVLEDSDGHAVSTAAYAVSPHLRASALVHLGVTYLQNRVEGGRWHYRATVEPAGVPVPHRDLRDLRGPDHPEYDAPVTVAEPSDRCPACGQRVPRG